MVIKSFEFDSFASKGCGSNVEVYSFGLQFIEAFEEQDDDGDAHAGQEIKLDINHKEPNLIIKYLRGFIKHTDKQVIHLEFLCRKPYDSVEIRTININDETAENQVQEKEKVESNHWYNFGKIKYEDLPSDGIFFFDFYFYSPMMSKLGIALYDLLKSELFSDIAVVSSDSKNFNVHKNIIASKSDVFKAHLIHDTEENTTGKISSMFDAEVITELLSYIYSEEVNNLDSVVERLLAAADFYKIIDLKSICELYLCQHLTVDNAIDNFKLADLHSASNLKKYAMRFIHIHHKKITQSAAWTEFEPNELMKELLYSFLQV